MKKPAPEVELTKACQDNPFLFTRYFMPDLLWWSGMRMIIQSVWRNQRTSVRACHGVSKTITAALATIIFLETHPNSIVITTAPTHRQVENLLWKEIQTFYRQYPQLTGNCLTTRIDVEKGWFAYGFSTDRQTNVEGHHAPSILWVLDEAKGLPKWLYDALEGSMTGGLARVLEISTTDGSEETGPFRTHHREKSDKWNCIALSAFDSPFIAANDYREFDEFKNKDLHNFGRPKRKPEWDPALSKHIQVANKEWIEDRREWQLDDPVMWDTKVCGRFAKQGEHSIIPMDWILSAVDADVARGGKHVFGLDIAEFGGDRNVLTERDGGVVMPQRLFPDIDPITLCGPVLHVVNERGVIQVDKVGIGAGTYWRMVELGVRVVGIESGGAAIWAADAYANLRAEMWWHARAVFLRQYKEGGVLSIPDEKELIAELASVRSKPRSDGRLLVEPKEAIRARIGRSPDKADSLIYCMADVPEPEPDRIDGELAKLLEVAI